MNISLDLSELYAGSAGRNGFYGIARVVAELAYEIKRVYSHADYFVYFSGVCKFIKVEFNLASFESGALVDAKSKRLRILFQFDQQLYKLKPFLPSFSYGLASRGLNAILNAFKYESLERNDSSRILFSASRPKFIARYINISHSGLRKSGQNGWIFASLLHDFFPLLDTHDAPPAAFINKFRQDNSLILTHSKYIFANSFFTKKCLEQLQKQQLLPAHPKVYVAQLGHHCREPQGYSYLPKLDQPYFLAVGCRPGRKNLQILLEAILLLRNIGVPRFHLALAGASRSSTNRLLKISCYQPIRSQVTLIESPSQAELNTLYKNALATLLPSFSEGWGLPASESLWFGTPVLVADTPIMHEVCGDLGVYFDPLSPHELASHMKRLLLDSTYVQNHKLIINGSRQSLRPWSRPASDIISQLGLFSGK